MIRFLSEFPLTVLSVITLTGLLFFYSVISHRPNYLPAPVTAVIIEGAEIKPEPVVPPAPPFRRLLPVYVETLYFEVSTYTPFGDGGNPKRPTASNRFDNRYDGDYKTLEQVIKKGLSICAVPWSMRYLQEELVSRDDGSMTQRFRVRFPWYDAGGVLRVPCDRVPYRGSGGELLHQRRRFDMFMHMPEDQARRHGVRLMPVEIFEMRWNKVR